MLSRSSSAPNWSFGSWERKFQRTHRATSICSTEQHRSPGSGPESLVDYSQSASSHTEPEEVRLEVGIWMDMDASFYWKTRSLVFQEVFHNRRFSIAHPSCIKMYGCIIYVLNIPGGRTGRSRYQNTHPLVSSPRDPSTFSEGDWTILDPPHLHNSVSNPRT